MNNINLNFLPKDWSYYFTSNNDLIFKLPAQYSGDHIPEYRVLHLRFQSDKEFYIKTEMERVILNWYTLYPILKAKNKSWEMKSYQGDICGPFCVFPFSRNVDILRVDLFKYSDGYQLQAKSGIQGIKETIFWFQKLEELPTVVNEFLFCMFSRIKDFSNQLLTITK